VHNKTVITFPDATGNWGTCTHFGIFDHVSAGNLLVQAPLTVQKTITINDTARFSSGTLSIRMD
jgi:hypothetical protein